MRPRIKALRTQQGKTQQELAAEVGCARSTLAGWESGKHGLPIPLLWKLARCLHVMVDDLYEYDDQAHTNVPCA